MKYQNVLFLSIIFKIDVLKDRTTLSPTNQILDNIITSTHDFSKGIKVLKQDRDKCTQKIQDTMNVIQDKLRAIIVTRKTTMDNLKDKIIGYAKNQG